MVHGLSHLDVDTVLAETPLKDFSLPDLAYFVNEISLTGLKSLPVGVQRPT